LEVGSAVKLRGVKIGTVKSIDLAADVYGDQSGTVLSDDERVAVIVHINYTAEQGNSEAINLVRAQKRLTKMIAEGLRLRLTTQGITGIVYIEADFYDPARYSVDSIPWTPDHIYIPSIPSALKEFSTAAERLISRLEEVDVEGVLENLNGFLDTLNSSAGELDLGAVQEAALSMIEDFEMTSSEIRSAVEQAQAGVLSSDVGETLEQFDAVLIDLRRILAGGRGDVVSSLDNVRAITENVRDLTDTLRAYPSLMLFSGEPERSDLGERK
jgi:paraquat-inducible protein B